MKDDLPKFSFGKMTSSLNALKWTKFIKIFFYLTVSGFDALKSKTCCQKLPKNLRGGKNLFYCTRLPSYVQPERVVIAMFGNLAIVIGMSFINEKLRRIVGYRC